jgi:DNA-binding transcriptional LysR family regulator
MNVRQLEAFCKTMETGSMSEAARVLGVTQPAISKSIRLLESNLGLDLFKRVGDRLYPSMEAQRLYPSARRVFEELQSTADLSRRLRTAEAGTLRIAATYSITATYVSEAMAAFHRLRPLVNVHFMALPPRQIVDLVASRTMDAGFLYEPITVPKVCRMPLCSVQVICGLPRHHHLAGKEIIDGHDLARETLISFSDETYGGSLLKRQCESAGMPWHVGITVNQTTVAMRMVADGIGVAVVDSLGLNSEIARNIVIKPFRPLSILHVGAIVPEDGPTSRLRQEFVDCVAAIAKRQAGNAGGFHSNAEQI